jgi:hypothetical protein
MYVLTFPSDTSKETMSDMAAALLKHEASMDCTVRTEDDGVLGFHRVTLAAMSEYFDKLFFGNFKESKEEVIAVTGCFAVWECIKSLVYKGVMTIRGMDMLTEMVETLYKYDLKSFVPTVWKAMKEGEDPLERFTALRLLRIAALHLNDCIGMYVMYAIRSSSRDLMDDYKWIQAYADMVAEIKETPTSWKQTNLCAVWVHLK